MADLNVAGIGPILDAIAGNGNSCKLNSQAGIGPILDAIAGVMFGPAAFLRIVFGSIFAGIVHDYFSGMLSLRHDGLSISEIVDVYLRSTVKQFMTVEKSMSV